MRFCWSSGLALSLCTGVIFRHVLFLRLNVPFTFLAYYWGASEKSLHWSACSNHRFFLVRSYLILQPGEISEAYRSFFPIRIACVRTEALPGVSWAAVYQFGCMRILWSSESRFDRVVLAVDVGLSQFHSPSLCISWCIAYAAHSKILSSTLLLSFHHIKRRSIILSLLPFVL